MVFPPVAPFGNEVGMSSLLSTGVSAGEFSGVGVGVSGVGVGVTSGVGTGVGVSGVGFGAGVGLGVGVVVVALITIIPGDQPTLLLAPCA